MGRRKAALTSNRGSGLARSVQSIINQQFIMTLEGLGRRLPLTLVLVPAGYFQECARMGESLCKFEVEETEYVVSNRSGRGMVALDEFGDGGAQ